VLGVPAALESVCSERKTVVDAPTSGAASRVAAVGDWDVVAGSGTTKPSMPPATLIPIPAKANARTPTPANFSQSEVFGVTIQQQRERANQIPEADPKS